MHALHAEHVYQSVLLMQLAKAIQFIKLMQANAPIVVHVPLFALQKQ
jgi:cystathionine beta-lyase family protein involved in aluminum resistance